MDIYSYWFENVAVHNKNKWRNFNSLIATLKPQSNGPSYSNTVIGILAVDEWAVTFGTARRGLGGAPARPGPSSLYQMWQPIHQRPVHQLRVIRCGSIIIIIIIIIIKQENNEWRIVKD